MSYPDLRYSGEGGEISAKFLRLKKEPDLAIGERVAVRYLATGESTNGQFGLYKWEMVPRKAGATPHFHRNMSESFFILSGMVRLFNGESWVDANAGDFLYVPQGGIHAFQNDSDAPASMLILFSPGVSREPYFEAIAEMASGRQFSEEEWAKICIKYDNYFIDANSQELYQKLLSPGGKTKI